MIKRIYLTILVMLFAVSGLLAQTPKVSIGNVTSDPGDVLVPVMIENFANLGSMTIVIGYDNEVAEFEGITNTGFGGNWVANASPEKITIVWWAANLGTGQNSPEDGHLLDLKMKYRGGFHTELNVLADESEFATNSLQILEFEYEDGSIGPDGFAGSVAMESVGASVGGTVLMPVTIGGEGFDAVSSFSLFIEIDPSQLDYNGVIPAAGVTGITASESGGVINVMWTGDPTDFNTIEGPVFELELMYKGGGIAQLRFKGTSEVSSDLMVLSTEFVDGFVFADVPVGSPVIVIEDVRIEHLEEDFDLSEDAQPGDLMQTYFVDVPIHAFDFATTAGSIDLVIGFDNTVVDFETFTAAQLTGWVVNAVGNKINVTWTSAAGAEIADGELLVLTFAYNKLFYTPLTFLGGTDIRTAALASMPVAFIGGILSATDIILYDLTLVADPEEGGEVTGEGEYQEDEEVEISAVPSDGYFFVSWTDEEGEVVSTDATTTITMPANELTLTANFELIRYDLILLVLPAGAGTVTGAGSYLPGEEVTVNTMANAGYKFVNWTDPEGNEVSDVEENLITMPESDLTLIANFVKLYTVSFNVNMKFVDGFYHRLKFIAASNVVYVTGSFMDPIWQQPGTNPDIQKLAVTAGNANVYTKSLQLEAGNYQYKYFINDGWTNGEWEGDPNRTFAVVDKNVVLNDWFGSIKGDPTSVDQPQAVELSLYPNPARSTLTIESGKQILEVRMMDMLGQLVYSTQVQDYRLQMNVSEFRSGIYFVQILTSEGFTTERVQITR